jgi:hypothetical protein
MADINVTEEIIDINVTEEVVNIIAPSGGYPLPNTINSVFGRVGNIVATEGDYTLTQLGDVTLTSPSNGQVLKYNGTQWVNSTDADTGITTLNTLTALSQTFATGTSGTDFNISSATSTHTFNLPTASATNRGLLSSADWSTFNSKQNALTNPVTGTGTTNTLPKFTGASTIGNSNVSDSGTLITLASNTTISSGGGLGIGISSGFNANSFQIAKGLTGSTTASNIAAYGEIKSDVTLRGFGVYIASYTQAAAFTLPNYYHYYAEQGAIGAGSTITTQTAFYAHSNLIGGVTNYGFRGLIPSGTNRWNLYMDGTANNYMAGSLGIGTLSIGGTSLAIGKNITGSATILVVSQSGVVQSDANANILAFNNQLNTQATSFALTQYIHYNATQGTIGAGSSVGTNTGFNVSPSMIGASANYGFRGSIPVGASRWNLYMDGMAANFLAGDTGIGTQTLGTATQLTVGGTETAVSAISRGQLINTTLVASANGDNLVGLDIAPTFNNGGFTGVNLYAIRASGNIVPSAGGSFSLGNPSFNFAQLHSRQFLSSGTSGFEFYPAFATKSGQWFTTGNLLLQNGGTFTDAGFRLDVNGTTRFIGTASSDTAPLGSELAAVTGTGTNWTLAGTNLNVGGYTHTVGSVDPLTTTLAAVNGTYYQIAYTITGRTAGSITINYGGTSTTVSATGASGPLASSTAVLTITPTTDFNGTVVLSIKTIGTTSASSTFASSGLVVATEIRASDIPSNLFFGRNNGRRNTTGTNNTFVGSQAGINNTTGNFNTFLGQGAGIQNTIGGSNTFLGINAGNVNTIGGANTFVGAFVGQSNTTGTNNTFVGLNSGQSNTTASGNTFVGQASGQANTTGTENTFLGFNSGNTNTTGNFNTFIGYRTGLLTSTGTSNTFVGTSSGIFNSTGASNSFIGTSSGQSNTTGSSNIFIGSAAGLSNTTGSNNAFVGTNSGRFIANGTTTITVANNSIFIGSFTKALADNQSNQIVIGHDATGLGTNTTVIGNSVTTTTGLYGNIRLVSGMGTAPASATATGTTGDIVVTAGFIYVCTATNTWVRTALTTW